jgi:DNA primase
MDPKDEIKDKIDLQELISEYLPLKPSGSGSFKGLCPFHSEKTPSFTVSPDKQIWHCFGCSEGGDCFSFIQKMEGMTFPEALMHLGKRVGVEIKRFSSKEGNEKQRALEMHELAETFYRKVLTEASGSKVARDYIHMRAIPDEVAVKFGIGFAPDEWNALAKVLLKRGYSDTEIVQAGLGLKKKAGSGIIDRFRNRIMIPLRDRHGKTVGFTGRVLPGSDEKGPKYMNSPETVIYRKSRLVFGLEFAKNACRASGSIIITEGNLDVVASHKVGVEHVVASSGTALTQDQLELMKRYTDTIIFAFDSDAAGFKAAKKGMTLAQGLEMDVRAIVLPEGVKDPDELVQQDPLEWKMLVEQSVPIMQFLIEHITRGKDFTNIDDKRLIAKELLPVINDIQNVVEREHWLSRVADLLRINIDFLRSAITPSKQPLQQRVKKELETTVPQKISKEDRVIQLIFGGLIQVENKSLLQRTKSYLTSSDLWITLYNLLEAEYDSGSHSAQKTIFSRLRENVQAHPRHEALLPLLDKASLLADETFQGLSQTQVLEQLETLITTLDRGADHRVRADIARQLRQAEASGDREEVARLLEQL